jgi:GTP-binding protein YchF
MKVGLIGLPGSGKTSLFNALTRSQARIHDYDAHDTTVNMATIPVPDPRFDLAVEICKPKKHVPASIEIVDGAARIQVGERGKSFGTDFFAGIRSVDALVLVIGAFHAPDPSDSASAPSPVRDADMVNQELILADLTVLDNRLERLAKARTAKRQTAADAAEETVVRALHAKLDEMRPLRAVQMTPDEARIAKAFGLVTAKPLILVLNVAEHDLGAATPQAQELARYAVEANLPLITLCAKLEAEIAQMSPEEEREFLAAMGLAESARDALIRVSYQQLGLISFLTVGSDEVRAWTIRAGTTALGAAERIHTDLARTFIRAEVMEFEDFRAAGGWDEARAAGKMRLEGKDYVVHDGEIVHIRNSRG